MWYPRAVRAAHYVMTISFTNNNVRVPICGCRSGVGGEAQLAQTCLPPTQSERDFSIKKSLETPREVLSGPDYVHIAILSRATRSSCCRSFMASRLPVLAQSTSRTLPRARRDELNYTRIAASYSRKRRCRSVGVAIDIFDANLDIDASAESALT
jgi:hypothetical protein